MEFINEEIKGLKVIGSSLIRGCCPVRMPGQLGACTPGKTLCHEWIRDTKLPESIWIVCEIKIFKSAGMYLVPFFKTFCCYCCCLFLFFCFYVLLFKNHWPYTVYVCSGKEHIYYLKKLNSEHLLILVFPIFLSLQIYKCIQDSVQSAQLWIAYTMHTLYNLHIYIYMKTLERFYIYIYIYKYNIKPFQCLHIVHVYNLIM